MRDPGDIFRPDRRPLRFALAAGAVVLLALLVWRSRTSSPRGPASATTPKPIIDSDANCELIRSRYRAALAPLQRCTRDEQCDAELRDGVHSAIDGCVRFRRIDTSLADAVEPLAAAFLARGCAHTFMTCTERRAQCSAAGTCTELPPSPLPRTWRRVQHANIFSFFVPPELEYQKVQGDDSEGGMFIGPKYELLYEYGDYSPTLEAKKDEGDISLRREVTTIAGVHAVLLVNRHHDLGILSGVQIPRVPVLGWGRRGSPRLTIWTFCKTESDCAEIPTIARSIEFH